MKDIHKHEKLKQESLFWTYNLRPSLNKQVGSLGKIAIYATNPGPANALQRLKDFGWEDNPLEKIVSVLTKFL